MQLIVYPVFLPATVLPWFNLTACQKTTRPVNINRSIMFYICKFELIMILRFILIALGIYILYKVVFDLVIPIFRATKKIRSQFGDIQQHMQDHVNAAQNGPSQQAPPQPGATPQKSRAGDYIDFEEVK
jgi:hypothetical protein